MTRILAQKNPTNEWARYPALSPFRFWMWWPMTAADFAFGQPLAPRPKLIGG